MTTAAIPPIAPRWLEANSDALHLESTVNHLELCQFQVDANTPGTDILVWLERDPRLPGVILVDTSNRPPASAIAPLPTAAEAALDDLSTGGNATPSLPKYLGMVSRQQILESFLHQVNGQRFVSEPLYHFNRYGRSPVLRVSSQLSIVKAAQRSLRRPVEYQAEPLVVFDAQRGYLLLNSHELNVAYWQIRGLETQVHYERIQAQMVQNDKMASLGRLVDGVAHEILDPVGFIWGNLTHISTYSEQLLELLTVYAQTYPEDASIIENLKTEIELDYIQQDMPRAIQSIRGGADRLRKLASSLQTFCHLDDVYPKPADLHDCLDSNITLLKERLTGDIEVRRDYGALPPVPCFIGQLSQVFMTLLVNAVDALMYRAVGHTVRSEIAPQESLMLSPDECAKPQIQIITQVKPAAKVITSGATTLRWASIRIIDNGPGLPPDQQAILRDTFAMEKRPTRETSLGLSYHIVTAKHGGVFQIKSPYVDANGQTHRGTDCEILLPIA